MFMLLHSPTVMCAQPCQIYPPPKKTKKKQNKKKQKQTYIWMVMAIMCAFVTAMIPTYAQPHFNYV